MHLRQQLWSLDPVQKYLDAGLEMLESEYLTSFILINDEQHVIAFADASIRHD